MNAADLALTVQAMIEEIDELESLILWLARSYSYEDPTTGEIVQNDPIFHYVDPYGHPLDENVRLLQTWNRVVKTSGI